MKKSYQHILVVFLTLFIFFLGGIIGLRSAPFFQRISNQPLEGTILQFGNNINTGESDFNKQFNPEDEKLFIEAYKIIKENFISFGSVSDKDLIYGLIKGLTNSLKDKHTEYFTPDETEKFNETLAGDFEGIGAVILHSDFGVLIDRILAGSPAKEAGLLSGDIIIKANNIDLKDMDLNDAVNKIRGPAGTKVTLEILRPGEINKITKVVTRRKIDIPSVDSKTLSGSLGYINLSIFGEKTAADFQKQLFKLYKNNIKGLIIDLRDNGGGFLDSAVDILSNFIEKDKVLVTTKEKNPLLNRSYFSYGTNYSQEIKKPKTPIPIVILINGNSASASEITAGALKDYKQAILVGEKSYGKGSVQEPFSLSDGSELKITVAKWYTPLDHGIDGIGITPDLEVFFQKEDYDKKYDRQFEEGQRVLKMFIAQGYDKTLLELQKEKQKVTTIENASGATNK